MPETFGNDGKVISRPSKRHILTVLLQNYKTSAVKRFIEKPMLPDVVVVNTHLEISMESYQKTLISLFFYS